MNYKYKILKARSVELLVALMNKQDLKVGAVHDYQIIDKGDAVYAVYKTKLNYREDIADGKVNESGTE